MPAFAKMFPRGGQFVLFVLAVSTLQSCFLFKKRATTSYNRPETAQEQHRNNQQIEKKAPANYTTYSAQSYIDRFKAIAIKEMNVYGIPASITLAQGMFESGNGNSDLARYANNHFGIKCTTDWTGKTYYKDDDAPNECFRVYSNPDESYRDHSQFLKRKRYATLYTYSKTDYRSWAYGLKAAGYATNPNYPQLIINIIEKYQLYQLDGSTGPQPAGNYSTQTNSPQIAPGTTTPAPTPGTGNTASTTYQGKTYTVKQGDTLYNISKRFGLTVDQLMQLNTLSNNGIKIGQSLIIAP